MGRQCCECLNCVCFPLPRLLKRWSPRPLRTPGMNSPSMATKEIKNGRLAMTAFIGFTVQVGPAGGGTLGVGRRRTAVCGATRTLW